MHEKGQMVAIGFGAPAPHAATVIATSTATITPVKKSAKTTAYQAGMEPKSNPETTERTIANPSDRASSEISLRRGRSAGPMADWSHDDHLPLLPSQPHGAMGMHIFELIEVLPD